ncbi:hypothetical protein [Microbacterium timonense]|uniref:hypothetical protein n=1 Tax=Microbacterium timonense TaxID=2086576 RepID=UPI000D0FC948|nr:hypothetical protein [Microbacterium timonense]
MSTASPTASPLRAPALAPRLRVRLIPAAPSLWRVVEPSGRVIGHLQQLTHHGAVRFRARRYHAASHAFRDLGDFWSADDAVESLRFTR